MSEAKQVAAGLFARVAADYDRAGFLGETARRLVARVPLRAGARVLDVACGTGGVLLAAAGVVGPRGMLVGVDLAEPMAVVARRLCAAGLDGVGIAVMDAERLGPRLEPTGRRLGAVTLVGLFGEAGFAVGGVVVASERLDVVYRDVDDWLAG